MNAGSWILPLLLCVPGAWCALRRVDVYAALTRGAKEGMEVILRILPALIALLPAVSMLRASGAVEWLAEITGPLWRFLGLPPECAPLMLVRPISGGAAAAVAGDLIRTLGPDSYPGRVAAVMLGSTETTFYTIAVYFGAAGITKTRHAIPAALLADAAGFLAAGYTVRLFFGT